MAQSTWSYLQNPFDNVTRNSQKLMFMMATDHFDKLAARAPGDAFIADLYNTGKPFFDAFRAQYSKGGNDGATYQMYTQLTEELLSQLSGTLARRWDVQIQVQFDSTSAQYKSLLPNGRGPFQMGAYDLRIQEVNNLSQRLAPHPTLAALRAEVDAFYAQLIDTRTKQQGIESTDQNNTTEIENTRLALAKAMHAIFGALLHRYHQDLSKVETFYEMKYLRRSRAQDHDDAPQASASLMVPKGGSVVALSGQLAADSQLRVTNTGAAVLTVFCAPNAQTPPPDGGTYTIAPDQSATIQAQAGDAMVVVLNETDPFDGNVLVELL